MLISGIIVLAFAFFGLTPSFFGGDRGRGVALSVNNEVISTLSFDKMVRSASRRQSAPRGKTAKERRLLEARLKQQLLNELLQLNVIYVSLANSRFYIASEAIIDQVVSTPAFSENGQFRRTRYESLLKSIGQTPDSFESQIEKSIVYQDFVGWIEQATQMVDLEEKLKNSVLNAEVHLDFFELKKPSKNKKALKKAFDKKIKKIKQLLTTTKVASINSWKKKNKLKPVKSAKVSLQSSYLPILGQNKMVYTNILKTKPGQFVNTLAFHKGAYYLIYVKAVKKAKAKNKASFGIISQWFARQRQQVAMQSWFQNYSKNLNIYTNKNLIKL